MRGQGCLRQRTWDWKYWVKLQEVPWWKTAMRKTKLPEGLAGVPVVPGVTRGLGEDPIAQGAA